MINKRLPVPAVPRKGPKDRYPSKPVFFVGDFKPRKLISDSFGFQCLFDFPGVLGLRNAFDNVSCSTFEGIATFKGRSLRNGLKPSVLKWRRRIEIALRWSRRSVSWGSSDADDDAYMGSEGHGADAEELFLQDEVR